jgi:hypothetical protein
MIIRTEVSMKKLVCPFALGLSLSMMVGFGVNASPQNAKTRATFNETLFPPPPSQKTTEEPEEPAAESVRLYYNRSGEKITELLNKILGNDPSKPYDGGTNKALAGNNEISNNATNQDGTARVSAGTNQNIIVVYGKKEKREELKRVIAILDLPRERVNMEMWGILISSNDSRELAKVMREVNQEIEKTQKLLRETYSQLEDLTKNIEAEPDYKYLFETVLGYKEALDKDRPSLSMTDILLRINAANDPVDNFKGTAQNICNLFKKPQYKDYVDALIENEEKTPFGNYREVGLLREKTKQQDCSGKTKLTDDQIRLKNLNRRKAVLNFALQYSELVKNPAKFDPEELQKSAEALNSVLTPLVDAINRDVEDLFIEPTLKKIQSIVSKYHNVQYAEVGKTSVAGLNGIQSTVSSQTVSTFDETGPLRLNEWLSEAGTVNDSVQKLLPDVLFGGSTIPVSSLISTVAALSKDNSQWRGLTSGVSIGVTPSVLRNSQSAELKIDFTTGPEKTMTEETNNGSSKLRPLSRIGQSKVSTTVYVETLDLFALSTFNNQTTEDGGRGYIPLIGPVWKGFFSGLPIVGDLFSWQNAPNNVQHQSIALTNTFIVPTAMGIAHLYGNASTNSKSFSVRQYYVKQYLDSIKQNYKFFDAKCNDPSQLLR